MELNRQDGMTYDELFVKIETLLEEIEDNLSDGSETNKLREIVVLLYIILGAMKEGDVRDLVEHVILWVKDVVKKGDKQWN